MPDVDYNARERRIIRRCDTPAKVQRFCDGLPYNREPHGPTLRTFRGVLEQRTLHCLEAALTAAAILEQHGYPPLLLDLHSIDLLDHVVFLFERRGKWGTVARSRDPGLHGRRAVFSSIEAVVRSYQLPFIDRTGRLEGWSVFDLRTLPRCNWRTSLRNVWVVERMLNDQRQNPLPTPERTYRQWHARYLRFVSRHPEAKPTYYPHRRTWLSRGP